MLNKIRELAKQKGIRISDLEKTAGIAEKTINRWDETAPSYDKVLKVARALGVTVEELAADEQEVTS